MTDRTNDEVDGTGVADEADETGEAAPRRLTHLDSGGRPRMVDVADKDVTSREAVAVGSIRMTIEALDAIEKGRTAKGDVLKVAELAGIMAGKRTGELIPLCHVLPAVSLTVELEADRGLPGVRCRAMARIAGKTGVEMEALTAASVALLTVYDMVKSLDRGMKIEGVELIRKSGGRSGTWTAESTDVGSGGGGESGGAESRGGQGAGFQGDEGAGEE